MKRLRIVWLLAAGIMACETVESEEFEFDTDLPGGDRDTESATSSIQPEGDPCSADSPWPCDPVTNQGCEGDGVGCDWGIHEGVEGFFCFTDCDAPPGAVCDAEAGPWCAAGSTCFAGICLEYCCGDADCPDGACADLDIWEHAKGPLGLCSPPVD